MLVLFAAVALVLLVASANVANLLLVRGEIRRPDLAVRTALGATRFRLARQIVSESLVLSVLAGTIGFAVAWVSLRALVAIAPGGLPRVDAIRVDGGVVLFVMALALVTTILAALVPALAAGRVDLVSHVQSGGRAVTRGTKRGRAALVAAQVALAVTVVAAAGLVTRSLLRLQSTGTELGADRLVHRVAGVATGSVCRPGTSSPVPRRGRERGSTRHQRLLRPRRSTPCRSQASDGMHRS